MISPSIQPATSPPAIGTASVGDLRPDTRSEEERAVKLALEGGRIERFKVAFSALRKLMADPDDTSQVFVMGLVLQRPYYPGFLARFASLADGDRLMRERPAIDSSGVDFDYLRALPADTLGGAFARFLDENGLDPDVFQPPPAGLPEVASYLSQRMRQSHDLWHVLTGYRTDFHGEAAVLAFSFGQTGMPVPALISFAATIKKGGWRRNFDAFKRGRESDFIGSVYWESRWERKLEDVRREFGIRAAAS